MFEERVDIKNKINPESISPHNLTRPDLEGSVEYEDTPEFRKSLNMPEVSVLIWYFLLFYCKNLSLSIKGPAKEALLKDLRDRLGLKEKVKVAPGSNPKVDWHGDEGEHGTHNEAKKG